MAARLYARRGKRASGAERAEGRFVALSEEFVMPDVAAPVPDARGQPRTALETAAEDEGGGAVEADDTQPGGIAAERDPQFACNGE